MSIIINFMRARIYNIIPMLFVKYIYIYIQNIYIKKRRIGRNLGYAKRQLENSLGILAAVHRKLSQVNRNFVFVTV